MPVIKSTCIRDLKSRVNIVDVVSRVATVRRVGSRFRALCPFHSEKTPSFYVNPDRNSFICFGCHKSGDVIQFVRETEQMNFTEAVEALAQRFGIVIEYEEGSGPSREERSVRQELYDLHEQAADHYHEIFRGAQATGEFMRTYWEKERGFPQDLADEFKVGAAEAEDSGLAARLLKRRYSEEALRSCGLFFIREGAVLTLGALRPRFRGRLMIPIRDQQGRVVAFTARQTALTPADDPAREAKYVNSPETPIFTKGQLVFNLDRARTAAKDGHPFVVVEGQLDALRCWQVGLKTAVAFQGTAVAEGQLALLRRYHPEIECLFDSDSAGQKAAFRLIPLALKAGVEVRFLALQGDAKIDPDLLFRERGLAAYDDLKRHAVTAMGYLRRHLLPGGAEASPQAMARAVEEIYGIVAATDSEVLRRQLLGEIAPALGALNVLPHAFERDFAAYLRRQGRPRTEPEAPAPTVRAPEMSPERDLLLLCLHHEKLGKPLSGALPHDWIEQGHPAGALLNRFLAEFEHDAWPGRDHLDPLLETPEEKALVVALLFDPPAFDDPIKVAHEGLCKLRARALEPRLRQIELALAKPPEEINSDPISLLKESMELRKQLLQPIKLAGAG